MQTSALSLQQLLSVVSDTYDRKANFLQALADHLGLEGSDARAQALAVLLSKISEVKEDISQLSSDDAIKKDLEKKLAHFNAILNLSQVHMSIEQAKNHFLKADSLLGLTTVHLALTGHIIRPSVERAEAEGLAEKFREIAQRIKTEDLPESLRNSFLKRTLKMAAILDHYYAFGPDDLQSELEGLVGAMVVSPPPKGSTARSLYKELAALSVVGLGILTTVDASLSKIVSIKDNASTLIEYVERTEDHGE